MEGLKMISKKLEKVLNDQLNFEYYSAYIYFSMVAHFKSEGLMGFANWMHVQTQEELCHGTGMYNYLIQRGGKVALQQIPAPPLSWKSPLAAFQNAYEHECIVTKRIHNIAAMAADEKDFALSNFIQWYVSEQVEEEANALEIIGQLKMAEKASGALFMIDKDLAVRAFVMPPIPMGGLTPGAVA